MDNNMQLMEALEIVDPETSADAMEKYAGDCQLANIAMTEARRVVCAAVRDLQTVKAERDAAVADAEELRSIRSWGENAPLTMDQLLQMNGQPVYVVGEPGGCIDGWQLVMIGRFDVDVVFFTSHTGYRVTLNEADKDIRAIYRRPPKEDEK